MDELRSRIGILLKTKGVSLTSMACGDANVQMKLSRQINRNAAITYDTVMLFLNRWEDVSAEWLVRGRGQMFASSQQVVNVDAQKSTINGNNNVLGQGNVQSAVSEMAAQQNMRIIDTLLNQLDSNQRQLEELRNELNEVKKEQKRFT